MLGEACELLLLAAKSLKKETFQNSQTERVFWFGSYRVKLCNEKDYKSIVKKSEIETTIFQEPRKNRYLHPL